MRRRLVIGLLIAAIVAVPIIGYVRTPAPNGQPTARALRSLPSVTGPVLLTDTDRIVLQDAHGRFVTIARGSLDDGALQHLATHARFGIPTRVWYRRTGRSGKSAEWQAHAKGFPGVASHLARPATLASARSAGMDATPEHVISRLGRPQNVVWDARHDGKTMDCWQWPDVAKRPRTTVEVCFDPSSTPRTRRIGLHHAPR